METFFTECQDTFDFFLCHELVELCSEEQGACFSGPLFPSFFLKWCWDVVCHLIGFIHFIFCTSVYSVFSLLLSLYSSSSFFFISASAAVFKLDLLLWGSAERNLSFITPSLLSVRMLLLFDTDLFKIGGKGQLESQFLTTQLKINLKKSKKKSNLSAFIQTKIEHRMNINDTKIIINAL